MRKLCTADIIDKFVTRWGTARFDYSQVDYQEAHKSVKVRCIKHDHTFNIYTRRHINGSVGCKFCQRESYRLDKTQALSRFAATWGDRYDYSKFEYKSQAVKSTIICKEHGEWQQEPVAHWTGHGCPRCAIKFKHGLGLYDNNNINMNGVNGIVYVLKIHTDTECFYKIGISKHSGKKRILDSGKKLSGKAVVLYQSKIMPLVDAYNIEQMILRSATKYTPSFKYNGWRESITDDPTEKVKELLNE